MKTRKMQIDEAWGGFVGIDKKAMEHALSNDGWIPASMLEPNLWMYTRLFKLDVNSSNEYRPNSLR